MDKKLYREATALVGSLMTHSSNRARGLLKRAQRRAARRKLAMKYPSAFQPKHEVGVRYNRKGDVLPPTEILKMGKVAWYPVVSSDGECVNFNKLTPLSR